MERGRRMDRFANNLSTDKNKLVTKVVTNVENDNEFKKEKNKVELLTFVSFAEQQLDTRIYI